MLRTRIWMGTLLIGLAGLILLEARVLAPYFPVLFVATMAAALLATRELRRMTNPDSRPAAIVCFGGVGMLVAGNWVRAFPIAIDIWHVLGLIAIGWFAVAAMIEMRSFTGSRLITERLSQSLLILIYLGVLPAFLVQMRWLPAYSNLALALAVFVPKGCDIGAYFTGKFLTGRLLGRTPMTPQLSPKKTVQGAIGGLILACVVAVALGTIEPIFCCTASAILFGLLVGTAGMLGDLAESLLKRDRQTKDASAAVPGFGGVLDVIDSLLFAAPVAYLWFIATL